MRVAIVGAGLAGLACAHELERLGVLPEIFEQQQQVGKADWAIEIMAQFMHHSPRHDIFDYLNRDLGLPLHPHSAFDTMILFSPSEHTVLRGKFGYTTIRGKDDRSLERQLAARLASTIHFGSRPDVWELRQEYDWVVVASGDHEWTRSLSRWTPQIEWYMMAAEVTGSFNPLAQTFFLNPRYAGTGYAMIAPIDEGQAIAGVGVPGISRDELEHYWKVFRTEQGHRWQQEVRHFRVDRWRVGQVHPCVIGNVLLVGHAGGFAESLGLSGQCPSLASGVMAARQMILGDRSLERFARQHRAHANRLWRLRRNVNAWTGEEMDYLVRAAHYGGSLVARSPWSVLGPASWALNVLHLADDPSPRVGPQ